VKHVRQHYSGYKILLSMDPNPCMTTSYWHPDRCHVITHIHCWASHNWSEPLISSCGHLSQPSLCSPLTWRFHDTWRGRSSERSIAVPSLPRLSPCSLPGSRSATSLRAGSLQHKTKWWEKKRGTRHLLVTCTLLNKGSFSLSCFELM